MNINRAENGFIKIHYKIKDSDLWQDHTALFVFMRMLFLAHFEDDFTSIRFAGKQCYLKRGEFSATVVELAEYLGISQSTLRKAILRLEEGNRVGKRTDRQTTIFRICNYSKYQDSPARARANDRANEVANEVANDRANVTGGKKNIKNIKNIKTNTTNVVVTANAETKKLFIELIEILGFPKAIYTDARRNKLKLRLKRYKPEQIKTAAKAIADSAFMQGDNPNGKRYGTIDFLIRSDEKLEEWLHTDSKQVTYKADW